MREKVIAHKNQVVAVILALLMTAVMPIVVLADTAPTISSPRDANSTIYTGDSFTLTASGFDSTTHHVDWTSSNTAVATISKHNGGVTVNSAGSVIFTATVMDGARPSGSGSGSTNCTASTGYETASISFTVAESTAYGYQGTGGNSMYMTALNGNSITNITAGVIYSGTNIVGYNNTITAPTAMAGTVSFSFMMSSGTNNFNPSKFNTNCVGAIAIDRYDGEDWNSFCGISGVSSSNYSSTTNVITIYSNSSLSSGKYRITFGAAVCGNNTSNNLGVPVSFEFTVVSGS